MNIGLVYENIDLKKYTTYKVGGTGRLLVIPDTIEKLVELLNYLKENNIKYKIIGNGSNLIFVNDYNGVLIKLDKLNNVQINDKEVTAEAGASLIGLALKVSRMGLKGMEFATGIPGTIGGAVYMNAGAYKEDMASIIKKVKLLDENDNIIELNKEELEFGYRKSILQSKKYVCLEATLLLDYGDIDEIMALIEKRKQKRIETQPLEYPSAGSVFRNPENGFAWQLIDDIGYKGKRIGDAMVSEKHANFIINVGNANGSDIKELIDEIKNKVKDKYNIDLKVEQEIVE
mgnify:FL=1